jgi:hypothetical protein
LVECAFLAILHNGSYAALEYSKNRDLGTHVFVASVVAHILCVFVATQAIGAIMAATVS